MQTVNSGTKVASGVALPSHITTRELNVRAGALTLAAAFLGWMFDGVEMGIFPLVARPALLELQAAGGGIGEQFVQTWMGRITAGFLFGAAAARPRLRPDCAGGNFRRHHTAVMALGDVDRHAAGSPRDIRALVCAGVGPVEEIGGS
jgi:hypothetical protein